MATSTFILVLLATTQCVFSQNNTTLPDYRLPTIYRPTAYGLHLTFTENSFSSAESDYSGSVTIQFEVTEPISQVKLHASPLLRLQLVNLAGNAISNRSVDNVTEIMTINVVTVLEPGHPYILLIQFTGSLRTSDTTGIYKSSYQDPTGVTKYLITTQFQPTSARKAFPCFDEPSFKSVFNLTVDCPLGLTAQSNVASPTPIVTNNGLQQFTFAPTPLMSTYLLAIVVSEFTCSEYSIPADNFTHAVCSRNESSQARGWAIELAPQLLASLNNFTGINYHTFSSSSKLDQVAIPDFAAGAMENWGLITYREEYLLWYPTESSNRYRQFVATIMSHELAHKWFGNLVTLQWWSETFLNEGFATYFEYFTTHEVLPEWQLDKQFVTNVLQNVLRNDVLETNLPLQTDVSTPTEVLSKFGQKSYLKGGSIFRMVEHIMGTSNFKTGLRAYLGARAYSNVLPEHLWGNLQANIVNTSSLPITLDVIMENWIGLSGFPLITASLQNDTVILTQSKFSLSGNNTTSQWYVPISYTTSVDLEKFVSTLPNIWLMPNSSVNITLPQRDAWIILNNQVTGYYRVNYDNELWNRIGTALGSANFGEIPEIQRAQIVDDLFNLARIPEITYSQVFGLIEFLSNDTSYFSWTAAFDGFNFLMQRVGRETVLGQEISNHLSRLMTSLYGSTPFAQLNETDHIYTLKQGLALSWACSLGKQDCIGASRYIYSKYRINGTRPNKNLRSIVYCNALRNSTGSDDWDFLWNQYEDTSIAAEKVTILISLGCTKNVTLLTRYLEKTLRNDSGIRPQNRLDVFSSVLNGNSIGIDVALEFLTTNPSIIAETYASLNSIPNILGAIASRITTQNQTDQLRQFIRTGELEQDYGTATSNALATAEANLLWLEHFREHLHNYYQIPNTTTTLPPSGSSRIVRVDTYFIVAVSLFVYYDLR